LSIAIGQGFDLVTPLQMAMLMAAIGNGGILYRPELLKAVETAEGRIVDPVEPVVVGRIPVRPEVLALVQEGLFKVVNAERGTARRINTCSNQIPDA